MISRGLTAKLRLRKSKVVAKLKTFGAQNCLKSILCAIIPSMSEKPQNTPILKRFRAAVAEVYGDRLERVVLYGSRARGDHQPDSDYDIAVFIKDPGNFYDES